MSTSPTKLRPMAAADQAFLQRLYASTRETEMSRSGWPAAVIDGFLRQQFSLQHNYYQEHFPDGEFWLIERAGEAIGRLYLFWGETTLQLIDIALLPEYRGAGLGTTLLDGLRERADARGLAMGLHVETDNPALRLYRRLGFTVIGESGIYLEMRRPAAAASASGRTVRQELAL
ncbi:GNAT family N-acetyltransferase [Pseudomonas sp. CrR25]|nr:GNAT family N-acetyltransferase [Pseudomonas sp. CrR25]